MKKTREERRKESEEWRKAYEASGWAASDRRTAQQIVERLVEREAAATPRRRHLTLVRRS